MNAHKFLFQRHWISQIKQTRRQIKNIKPSITCDEIVKRYPYRIPTWEDDNDMDKHIHTLLKCMMLSNMKFDKFTITYMHLKSWSLSNQVGKTSFVGNLELSRLIFYWFPSQSSATMILNMSKHPVILNFFFLLES